MDPGTKWIALWDAITAEAKKVTNLPSDHVVQGLRFPPIMVPMVMIPAGSYRQISKTTSNTNYEFSIPIYVFSKDADPYTGTKEVIRLMGKIVEQLVDDRTLGGLCESLEDPECTIDPAEIPEGYERQCGRVLVTVREYL